MIDIQQGIYRFGIQKDNLLSRLNQLARDLMSTEASFPRVMNNRNLTDRRGRIGILLEYSMPHMLNDILGEGSSGYIVSNRFGDIYLKLGDKMYWIEIKCLDLNAEEYAGNLTTPIAWIPPSGLLMIIVYENTETYDSFHPNILDVGVFEARAIAKMRNYGWLKADSTQILLDGASLKGNGYWKREEENLGKLGRIAKSIKSDILKSHYFSDSERREINDFRLFLKNFDKTRAEYFLERVMKIADENQAITSIRHDNTKCFSWLDIEKNGNKFALVFRYTDIIDNVPVRSTIMDTISIENQWWILINPKFQCTIYAGKAKQDSMKKMNLLTDDEIWEILKRHL